MTFTKIQKDLLSRHGNSEGIYDFMMDKHSAKTLTAFKEKGILQDKCIPTGTGNEKLLIYKFTSKGKKIAQELYDIKEAKKLKELSKPLKVESGIPMPDIKAKPNASSPVREALSKMAVGDSFVCSYEHTQRAYMIYPKLGIKIMIRMIPTQENIEGKSQVTRSYRVWRTA
jgi:hypothetical protein